MSQNPRLEDAAHRNRCITKLPPCKVVAHLNNACGSLTGLWWRVPSSKIRRKLPEEGFVVWRVRKWGVNFYLTERKKKEQGSKSNVFLRQIQPDKLTFNWVIAGNTHLGFDPAYTQIMSRFVVFNIPSSSAVFNLFHTAKISATEIALKILFEEAILKRNSVLKIT